MKKKPKYYGAKVKCLGCNTIVQSKHVHDFRKCACKGENGIYVDGGGDYLRMGYYTGAKWEVIEEGNYMIGDKD